MLTKLIKIR